MIGLLSFHQCHNYGAVLQAYALQEYLNMLGYESEYIHLNNEIFEWNGKKAGHILYRQPNLNEYFDKEKIEIELKNRWRKFEEFINKILKCSEIVSNEEEIRKIHGRYSLLMVGGDQLWNCNLAVSQDVYALPFITDIPKVSYGTSLGNATTIPLRKRMFLKQFSNIGVRESVWIEYIKKYTEVSCSVNVDPVFLLDKEKWRGLAKKNGYKEYVFAYVFNNTEYEFLHCIKKLREYANKNKIKVILCANDYVEDDMYLKSLIDVSPLEWLGYIKDSEYVVTNSFHGLAFSIVFQKQFLLLNCDERKEELLKICDIEYKRYDEIDKFIEKKYNDVDYIAVKQKLGEAIYSSKMYLKKICELEKKI